MKKLLCALLALVMLCSMAVPAFAANETTAFISYNKGDNKNPGTDPSAPKKSLGTAGAGGAADVLANGGVLVVTEKLHIGADYTWNVGGPVTIKGSYNGVDYKNPEPASNPAGANMKFAGGKALTVESDLTIDDVILFQEGAQNTFVIKSGATFTVTENVVCMSKQTYYTKIIVEAGATANINGGTFSSVTGNGTINIGAKATILDDGAKDTDAPSDGVSNVCFLNYAGSDANNTGLTPDSPIKGYTNGVFKVLPAGGTVVVTGKSYIAGTSGNNSFTIPAFSNPITFTSVYNGVDYKNPEPATNPACAWKMGSGTVLHINGDIIFDDIILFQENNQNTLHVNSGSSLTVTDSVQFLTKPGNTYHFKVVIDSGAVAFLSEEAQKVFDIENNGDLFTYEAEGATTPDTPAVTEKTEVKLTIGSTTAYVNGVATTLDAAPINRQNRTLLPVRFLANAFGVPNEGINWSAETRTATLKNDSVTIIVTIDSPTMTVNGETVKLDAPAIIEGGRTYLPVRAIANALGVANENIAWDAATSTATLVK